MVLGAAAAVALVAGCEWDTAGKSDSWSDSYNWVNFSGTYRNAQNDILVSDYTKTKSTEGSTNSVSVSETGGVLAGKALAASGVVAHKPIDAGSFAVRIGSDVTLTDNGSGVLSGSGGSGAVSYTGGTWSFQLADTQWSVLSRAISLDYSYTVAKAGEAGGESRAGSTGRAIYSFVVEQQGQNLTITDSNGATYKGRIGTLRSTSGGTPETAKATADGGKVLPKDGDTVVATFNCKGVSAAGMSVTITGTFSGTVAANVFTGRTMQGTWIEAGGRTGDINGTTVAVTIQTASSSDSSSSEE
jgi:hypothetical protein